jgi:pyruvate,water dikinase
LELGQQVFFLISEEALDLLAGRSAPVECLPTRQRTYERYRALPPYPPVICGQFEPFEWAADPNRRYDIYDSHVPELRTAGMTTNSGPIKGVAGAAGQVVGRVRRLDSPEEGSQFEQGEILVTAQTNIGWTLIFPRAAAVVTDVGAPLSHAAIVARELGIPAVVNCGDATRRLKTGDRVRVDGSRGVVEVLEKIAN